MRSSQKPPRFLLDVLRVQLHSQHECNHVMQCSGQETVLLCFYSFLLINAKRFVPTHILFSFTELNFATVKLLTRSSQNKMIRVQELKATRLLTLIKGNQSHTAILFVAIRFSITCSSSHVDSDPCRQPPSQRPRHPGSSPPRTAGCPTVENGYSLQHERCLHFKNDAFTSNPRKYIN